MSNVRCKLIIENIYLDVCKVQVNKYCMSGHKAALEIANGMYPLQKTVIIAKNYLKDREVNLGRISFKDMSEVKWLLEWYIQLHFWETSVKTLYDFNILI